MKIHSFKSKDIWELKDNINDWFTKEYIKVNYVLSVNSQYDWQLGYWNTVITYVQHD